MNIPAITEAAEDSPRAMEVKVILNTSALRMESITRLGATSKSHRG